AAQRTLCRCPTPRERACGPYGLSLLPPSCYWLAAGVSEVSRFSCMKLPGVSGVYDYAGPNRDSRFRPPPVLPSANAKASASWLHPFEAQYPARLYPCLRFAVHLAMHNAKLGAEWFATPFS
ncbi:MAG TPA: hypothetical protein VK638_03215, partial [Edaphobacter sp.]|nr:hypothetical protein [Edaphobacter sp.]